MSAYASLTWDPSIEVLQRNIRAYGEGTVDAVEALVRAFADQAQGQLRRQAPWNDRTGRARRELHAEVERDGLTITMYLIHGAPYGVYLELRWGGRYAVIGPVTMETAVRLGNALKAALAR